MKNKDLIKKSILITLIVFILILLGLNTYNLLNVSNRYKQGTDAYNSIKQIAKKETTDTKEPSVDFDALEKINPDVVGWLKMEDTVIDYPIVHGKDNDYYLDHIFDGTHYTFGTIFIDFRNRPVFEDDITVIYGHAMLDGSMFKSLEQFESQSYADEHQEFSFETREHKYRLEPFAGKIVDAQIPFLELDFDSDEDYLKYLQGFIDTSTFKSNVKVTGSDKVVMMITCSHDFEEARYVLLSKVVEIS